MADSPIDQAIADALDAEDPFAETYFEEDPASGEVLGLRGEVSHALNRALPAPSRNAKDIARARKKTERDIRSRTGEFLDNPNEPGYDRAIAVMVELLEPFLDEKKTAAKILRWAERNDRVNVDTVHPRVAQAVGMRDMEVSSEVVRNVKSLIPPDQFMGASPLSPAGEAALRPILIDGALDSSDAHFLFMDFEDPALETHYDSAVVELRSPSRQFEGDPGRDVQGFAQSAAILAERLRQDGDQYFQGTEGNDIDAIATRSQQTAQAEIPGDELERYLVQTRNDIATLSRIVNRIITTNFADAQRTPLDGVSKPITALDGKVLSYVPKQKKNKVSVLELRTLAHAHALARGGDVSSQHYMQAFLKVFTEQMCIPDDELRQATINRAARALEAPNAGINFREMMWDLEKKPGYEFIGKDPVKSTVKIDASEKDLWDMVSGRPKMFQKFVGLEQELRSIALTGKYKNARGKEEDFNYADNPGPLVYKLRAILRLQAIVLGMRGKKIEGFDQFTTELRAIIKKEAESYDESVGKFGKAVKRAEKVANGKTVPDPNDKMTATIVTFMSGKIGGPIGVLFLFVARFVAGRFARQIPAPQQRGEDDDE